MMCEQELQYWDWVAKVTERLTFARLKVNDRKDISEEDYQLLKVLFPIWYNGEYPIYQTKMEDLPIQVRQATIFDNLSEGLSGEQGGIFFVKEDIEPNDKEE